MQSKFCNGCQQTKDIEEFTRSSTRANFKTLKHTHHSYCKACNAERAREWRKNRPNYRGSGRLKAVPEEDRLLMSAIRQRLADARGRCKKYDKPAPTVTDQELYELFVAQNRACALTSTLLVIEKDHPLCLSLDKKEPDKGYDIGNIQWLAWCVNRAKGDLSLDHFYEMCEVVLENRKVQRLSKGGSDPNRVE